MTAEKTVARQSPEPTPAATSRAKRMMVGAAVGIGALGVAYGAGRLQGKLATDAADRRTEEANQQRQRASGEFDAQRDRALRLEARRRLHLALIAVEDRNFGIAQSHLDKAATLLGRSRGNAKLDSLTGELEKDKLGATDDVGAIRQRLLGYVREFDEALPPAEP
jgi:F0F1-type ATP synthase membrane subunit c/vacuolar-type H+-ATPase subunit K